MNKRPLIAKPITAELEKFSVSYKESIACDNQRVQEIIDYTLKSDGKRVRPILLLLAAKACGEINETTYASAVTIELLHTASLIHDDVVDESKMRRGRASLNAVFDNKMAILAGDFFLSTALIKSVLTANLQIISDVSDLGRNLAEGELNQLSLVKELILDETEYFEVIKKKTASLLSTCMRIGAISVGAEKKEVEKYSGLGEILGICFQLRDDIFDYYTTDVGKPTGNDIREGKITLPLLYALKASDGTERDKMMAIIYEFDFTPANVQKLIDFAKERGGIEYAYEKMRECRDKAADIIDTVENDEVREALQSALDYILERAY